MAIFFLDVLLRTDILLERTIVPALVSLVFFNEVVSPGVVGGEVQLGEA